MYLCCIESLSSFRSNLNFLRIFKVAQINNNNMYIITCVPIEMLVHDISQLVPSSLPQRPT